MILADIPELQRISDTLIFVASETDEVLNSLRRTQTEIQNDVVLETYPQYTSVCEAVARSIDALNLGNDTLQTLKGILASAAGEYEDNESKNINALNRMTALLSNIQVGLNTSVSPGQITTVEQTIQINNYDRVRALVSENAAEMQITNVAAIEKIIDEEYSIKEVCDMSDT